jgi:WXG100 family type VII secretion target
MGWWQMSTKFAIRDDAVNRHAVSLDTSVGALNSQAAAFEAAIAPLPQVWQGTAFQSWDQLSKAWQSAMKDLNQALDAIRGRVGDAGGLYDRYHQQQAEALQAAMGAANWDGTKFRG